MVIGYQVLHDAQIPFWNIFFYMETKTKKIQIWIAQFSQNKADFPPFFLLTFSSGGIPPPQIPPFLGRNTKYNPNVPNT